VPERPIAVLCAFEPELVHLRGMLPPGQEQRHAGRVAWLTALGDQPVVLAHCGIGMVSAGAVAESVIGRYEPGAVLNYGCVGAHRPELLPGDLIVGSRYVHYQNTRELPDGTVEWHGPWYLRGEEAGRVDELPADPALLAAALAAAAELEGRHEPWPATIEWPEGIDHRRPVVAVGTVCSGDRWNRSRASIEALMTRHDSYCEDMEAAALALVCFCHSVPFLAIKDVSNNELLRTTGVEQIAVVTKGELGRRAAVLTLATMRRLAGRA
jgi:adenosylhomocysteine nucleosidase